MSDNTCKVILAMVALMSTVVISYKEIRLAEISNKD